MKKTFSNIRTLAALLMAGAAFAACSNSDDIINEQPVNPVKQGYTLTVSASKDGSATRALDLKGGAVVASWETTDEIVVTKNGTQIGTLSPTNIEGLNATFTGTISGDADINVDDVLTLSYHPIAGIEGFASQNGTLNDLAASAENFDMAIATVHISEISGKNIIVSESSANFVNQTAVVVLSPYNSSWSEYHSLNSLTVSVTMDDIPEVGTVTEKIGPITVTGDQPYYFSLPSQALLAEALAAKYSLDVSAVSTLLASATVTFTGHQTGDDFDREYLTCSKTGYKFAAGKYYKLDNSNFSMTFLYKHAAAGKDVYVSSSNTAWSNTVTFAVNKEIGWKVVGDNVYCGDKQLYVEYDEGLDHIARWVKASDDFNPFGATYTLEYPVPTLADVFTDGAVVGVAVKNTYDTYTVTGTYSGGSYTSYTKSSNDIEEVTMTKDGNNLVVWIKNANNSECTLTFNTQDNTYTTSFKAGTAAPVWNLSEFVSITVNGTDITSTLTEAAPTLASESFDTNLGNTTTYDRTHFTITCSDQGDSDGIQIANDNTLTITAKGSETIKKVEFHCGAGQWYASKTTVTAGTLNWTDGSTTGSIDDVNATTVTMSNSGGGWIQIDQITVYYE